MSLAYAELSSEALELVHGLEEKLHKLTGEKIVLLAYKEEADD